MKKLISLFVLALLFLSTNNLYAVGRDPHPFRNDPEYAGERCNTPKKGSNIVAGYFSGYQEAAMPNDSDYAPIDRFRCFKTIQQCRDWMYIMQSRYGIPPPRITSCKQY